VDTPQPVKPIEQGRDAKDDDAAWDKRKKDHAPVELAYVLQNQKWVNAHKKCMAFIKNTIENAIAGSIAECTFVGEFLEKIKSQFTALQSCMLPSCSNSWSQKSTQEVHMASGSTS
jgi:hypothetical protein